jgi:hypothetical protein
MLLVTQGQIPDWATLPEAGLPENALPANQTSSKTQIESGKGNSAGPYF